MKSAIRSTLAACLALIGTASLHAQTSFVPQGMSYQGFLTDENGNPVANAAPENRNVQFRVYSQATGGSALWGEEQTVTVFKGNFSVILGNGSAISGIPSGPTNFANLFTAADSENRFFGITPQGGPEFSPRQRILSSAYALRARVAESVTQTSGFSIFPEVRSTGQIKLTSTGQAGRIELGSGVVGKEQHAGTISYQGYSLGLDIVGAGNNTASRVITMWAEGGTEFKGNISFGSRLGQHINFFGAAYGMGLQNDTLYFRTGSDFAWHRGGVHTDTRTEPGSGGTRLATLTTSGFNLQSGVFTGNGSGLTNLPSTTTNFTVTDTLNASKTLNVTETLTVNGTQNFGMRLGQHLNLYGTTYAMGVQPSTFYSRADGGARFSWYIGGSHTNATNDPGDGGTLIANWNTDRVEFNRAIHAVGTNTHANTLYILFERIGNTFRHVYLGGTPQYDIKANGSILARDYISTSDARIKNIIQTSDAAADINTLRALKVTDYTMKDQVQHGDQQYKMLIAQEVEEVYPQAVQHQTDVLPDIFRTATVKNSVIEFANRENLELEMELTAGDKVRLLQADETILAKVTRVHPHGFEVEETLRDGEIFVYGREVDDFRTVDYDAIAMLNVSATQELLRRLEAQEKRIEQLQQEKSEMSKEVANLRQQSTTQDARLARLESLIKTVEGASGSPSSVGGASGSPSQNPNLSTVEPVTTLAR